MPAVEMHLDVPPAVAWEVLASPREYGYWVTGANEVEDADPHWPAQGAVFRHKQGLWPFHLRDTTEVLVCRPPHRLELEVRVRPLLVARVVLSLQPEAGGARVWMDEIPTGGALAMPLRVPPGPQAIRARNLESLRRLRRLADERARAGGPSRADAAAA